MEFNYGISPESLTRWLAFQRILAVQEQCGATAGQVAMKTIVNGELDAIERATLERELREAEPRPAPNLARVRRFSPSRGFGPQNDR